MHMHGHGSRQCSRQRLHVSRRISFAEVEASILARFPHYKLDRSTFTSAGDPIAIDCPIHGYRFRARPLDIFRDGVPGCPECRAEHRRAAPSPLDAWNPMVPPD